MPLFVLLDEPADPAINTQVLRRYFQTFENAVQAAHDEILASRNNDLELAIEPAYDNENNVVGYALFSPNDELVEMITVQAVYPA